MLGSVSDRLELSKPKNSSAYIILSNSHKPVNDREIRASRNAVYRKWFSRNEGDRRSVNRNLCNKELAYKGTPSALVRDQGSHRQALKLNTLS